MDGTQSVISAGTVSVEQEWWRGAVIYQIYPRSFFDSNNDGIGDLNGISQKMDYVASLGVDGIWISPFFKSPMKDFGYDVADYCDVDPIFGTLSDFDDLIQRAHACGLKVIIDQVYSHTSDEHSWFTESRVSRDNAKHDWYVWADPKPDGSPPNNWQSVFGGPAWTWDARRCQYYLHNFLSEQPQLNVHNRDVQDALLSVTKFWLDRGVDGFRLDAINFAMHNQDLTDNPAWCSDGREITRPFDLQHHIHNQSQPEIVDFIERIRAVVDEHGGAFTVAEVGGPNPIPEMKAFTQGDKRFSSAYNFDFLYAEDLTPERVRESVSNWGGESEEGWPSWAFSNHDAPRAISRWHDGSQLQDYAKLINALLLSLRGNPILYQGDELGLPQAEIPFHLLKDPEAIANWPRTLGRDGARTPLPWDTQDEFAGFADSKPWLPVTEAHAQLAISRQSNDPDSALNFLRRFLQTRKSSLALQLGGLSWVDVEPGLLGFIRSFGSDNVMCLFNLSPEAAVCPKSASEFSTTLFAERASTTQIGPFGFLILSD